MRFTPLILLGVLVVAVACEDDEVGDCIAQGGICGVVGVTGSPLYITCDGKELPAEQCRQSGRAVGYCCRPKKCAEGRGICRSPCASGRQRIHPLDDDCANENGSLTDCCEP